MNEKDNIEACYWSQQNLYFNVSITSRELQTSRLGLELLRLVPIPSVCNVQFNMSQPPATGGMGEEEERGGRPKQNTPYRRRPDTRLDACMEQYHHHL